MPTKRQPKIRRTHRVITDAAIAAFRRMEDADTDDEWWEAHSVLHKELYLPPWEWPAFEYPDEECPYPVGSYAAKHWQQCRDNRPQAFELYDELMKAARGSAVTVL